MVRVRTKGELPSKRPRDGLPPVASAGLLTALRLLHDAAIYAADVGCDRWKFAVDWATCRDRDVSPNDLRWLIHAGLVDHKRGSAHLGRQAARSRRPTGLPISDQSCFVLNAAGQSFARATVAQAICEPARRTVLETVDAEAIPTTPHWDKTSRTLRLGDEIVKRFRVPAKNQETVLEAFEEEGWPGSIDDPLPPSGEVDSKRRLHETIRRLNNNQPQPRLHFYGNGNGRAICWQIATSAPTDKLVIAGRRN